MTVSKFFAITGAVTLGVILANIITSLIIRV